MAVFSSTLAALTISMVFSSLLYAHVPHDPHPSMRGGADLFISGTVYRPKWATGSVSFEPERQIDESDGSS